ncbi:aminoglycoside phosphotransferase family protein [Streptomyces sp. NPDC060006]|uniref:aminoglycoside phosphotransferase family protein n=1 Tax=unclassified Streptomyces TaxID=2593676 RepID=UPI00367CF16E
MGAHPASGPASRERRAADDAYDEFVRRAKQSGVMSRGHHHRNYVLPLTEAMARYVDAEAGTPAVVRIRRPEALPVVVRTWRHEARILDAARGILPQVPRCLATRRDSAVHTHVEGIPLSRLCPSGKPVDGITMGALAEVLARMSQVRREALPPLPADWPRNDKDSQGFLRMLTQLADRQIRQPNWAAYGGLFAALGVPEDALTRLAARVPAMARRPYSLLHADLHRDNVVVTTHGDPHLVCVDWELATYGDPLHDLATHLVRMRYSDWERDEAISAWAQAMQTIKPAATNGLARDLRHYIAFEHAQSVFPDVIRAARSLQDAHEDAHEDGHEDERLTEAVATVRQALASAAEPLGLSAVPEEREVERVLHRWQTSWRQRGGRPAVRWKRDRRVERHPGFPPAAVHDALVAEGAAPTGRVFKGTAHLNTVVRVPDVDFPVVVRRKIVSPARREPRFLSEHAVLRAIERSKVAVTAPRVLALGESHPEDLFAIHTYVGPLNSDQPPNHPVLGLLPHEADGLVGQLAALTDVDFSELDPTAREADFHHWLSDQLVLFVAQLPSESQQLARAMGLPDATRLKEILARHELTFREPTLLHGDLNPWNLVRRDDSFALTIIDWEMAMVGDPLYDLVRHLHLTPTRPEIRDRLFRAWEKLLPATHTRDWRKDWRVYRWIELVRSAYVDLDRMVTGAGLDAPNVRRAVDSYAMTLRAATASLGLPLRPSPRAGGGPGPARRDRGPASEGGRPVVAVPASSVAPLPSAGRSPSPR